jgi:hypothetical protein
VSSSPTSKSRIGRTRSPAWTCTRAASFPRSTSARDIEAAQDFERAWLHCKCARLVRAIQLPVDDPDARTERVQLGRKREPCRARADDKDVRLARCSHGSVHRTGICA